MSIKPCEAILWDWTNFTTWQGQLSGAGPLTDIPGLKVAAFSPSTPVTYQWEGEASPSHQPNNVHWPAGKVQS